MDLDNLTWVVRATVLRILDGDTFAAMFDLGWGVLRQDVKGAPCRVRVLNYYAPELRDAGGHEAREALVTLLPLGSTVWVASHALDSFGRALCTVYMPGGTNLLDLLPQEYRRNKS